MNLKQNTKQIIILIVLLNFISLYIIFNISAWWSILVILATLMIAIAYLFPLFTFPDLSGIYKVGTKIYLLEDKKRLETHTNLGTNRELLIQFWYPASPVMNNNRAKYMPEIIRSLQDTLKKSKYAPLAFVLHKLFPTHSNAYENAPINSEQEKYPVVIFSHGLGGICNFSTSLIEELVSHGYIVIGLNHPYSSYVTVFPDGRTVSRSQELDLSVMKILKDCADGQYLKIIEKEFNIWLDDAKFLLDYIFNKEQKDIDEDLIKKLDLELVGMYGHSLGGAMAAEVCRIDSRVKAGISLDGSLFDQTVKNGFDKPFLFIVGVLLADNIYPSDKSLNLFKMSKQDWNKAIKKYKESITILCNKIGEKAAKITIEDAGHFAFTDISLLRPFWAYLLNFDIGSWKCWHVISKTNKYVVDFFNMYLKN